MVERAQSYPDSEELLAKAQAFVDRKYVARADERQKSMGLAYVEAERQDLAREIARFAEPFIANAGDMVLRMGEAVEAMRAERDSLRGVAQAVQQPSDELVRLVIAARVVAFQDQSPDAIRELDEASEAFAEIVHWEDEPADLRSGLTALFLSSTSRATPAEGK